VRVGCTDSGGRASAGAGCKVNPQWLNLGRHNVFLFQSLHSPRPMLALGCRSQLRSRSLVLPAARVVRKNAWCNHYTNASRFPALPSASKPGRNSLMFAATTLFLAGAGYVAYEYYTPFRHTTLAVVRCSRVAGGPGL
jgi:hypothetical protein